MTPGQAETASRSKLSRLMEQRLSTLEHGLRRSLALADAAALLSRFASLRQELRPGTPPTGSQYLRLRRELAVLEGELGAAETALAQTRRQARAELQQVADLLCEMVPDRGPALSALLLSVPVDAGMAVRLRGLVSLIRTRQQVVPRLMAARPNWKK